MIKKLSKKRRCKKEKRKKKTSKYYQNGGTKPAPEPKKPTGLFGSLKKSFRSGSAKISSDTVITKPVRRTVSLPNIHTAESGINSPPKKVSRFSLGNIVRSLKRFRRPSNTVIAETTSPHDRIKPEYQITHLTEKQRNHFNTEYENRLQEQTEIAEAKAKAKAEGREYVPINLEANTFVPKKSTTSGIYTVTNPEELKKQENLLTFAKSVQNPKKGSLSKENINNNAIANIVSSMRARQGKDYLNPKPYSTDIEKELLRKKELLMKYNLSRTESSTDPDHDIGQIVRKNRLVSSSSI